MKRFIATLVLAATATAAVPAMAQSNKTQASGGTYEEAVLVFMSNGTPTTEEEILKLNAEEIRALHEVLNANDGQPLEALSTVNN